MTIQSTDLAPAAVGFTTVRRDVVAALAATGLAIPKRAAAPTMRGVLVTATAETATFAGFDFDTAVQVTVPSVGVAGRWLVSHEELTRMVAAGAKGERKAVADQMSVTLSTDPSTGETLLGVGGYTIPLSDGLDVEEYPNLPSRPEKVATIDRVALARAVKRVMAACGTDDMLPVLSHINVAIEDGAVRLETTDRFRLTLAHVPAATTKVGDSILVPGKTLEAAMKHLTGETVDLHIGEPSEGAQRRAVFVSAGVEVSTAHHDGEFPRIASLVPRDVEVTATVSVEALRKAAQKAAALTGARGSRNQAVEFAVTSTGVSVIPTVLEAKTAVTAPETAAEVSGIEAGSRFVTGFNPVFLIDLLAGFDAETVALHFTSPHKPMTATETSDGIGDPTAFKHLLMPRRLL